MDSAIMSAAAGYFYNLNLHPVLATVAGIFSVFHGLALVLILWMNLPGWLTNFGEKYCQPATVPLFPAMTNVAVNQRRAKWKKYHFGNRSRRRDCLFP